MYECKQFNVNRTHKKTTTQREQQQQKYLKRIKKKKKENKINMLKNKNIYFNMHIMLCTDFLRIPLHIKHMHCVILIHLYTVCIAHTSI